MNTDKYKIDVEKGVISRDTEIRYSSINIGSNTVTVDGLLMGYIVAMRQGKRGIVIDRMLPKKKGSSEFEAVTQILIFESEKEVA